MDSQALRTQLLSEDIPTYTALTADLSREKCVGVVTELLEACVNELSAPIQVRNIIQIGRDETRWNQGHSAFDAVRVMVLEIEGKGASGDDLTYLLLFVAENAARVIYNASNPSDPFDDDSPAWFLKTYIRFARRGGFAPLIERAVQCLSRNSSAN